MNNKSTSFLNNTPYQVVTTPTPHPIVTNPDVQHICKIYPLPTPHTISQASNQKGQQDQHCH